MEKGGENFYLNKSANYFDLLRNQNSRFTLEDYLISISHSKLNTHYFSCINMEFHFHEKSERFSFIF